MNAWKRPDAEREKEGRPAEGISEGHSPGTLTGPEKDTTGFEGQLSVKSSKEEGTTWKETE